MEGYRWFQNGTKLIPKSEPVLKKIYFQSVVPTGRNNGFKRVALFLLHEKQPQKAVLLHYLGDENSAVDFPHRNSTGDSDHAFHRTCPSVLARLTSIQDLPSNIYKNAISNPADCPPELQPVYMPRNFRQIKNIQYKERQQYRLTHDTIFNLHEVAYDLDDFVKEIITFPDLILICGLNTLIDELDHILQVDSECSQLLSYDMTFQLGDFYVSPLLYRHTLFSTHPVMPAIFIIHELKFQSVHEHLMQYLAKMVPTLVEGRRIVPLVTDEEIGKYYYSPTYKVISLSFLYLNKKPSPSVGCNSNMLLCITFIQAIEKHLPKVIRLHCWNHTINAVKVWLKKHGASSAEVPVYISHLREMLSQSSACNYEEKLEKFKVLWSEPFCRYYMNEIHPEVTNNLLYIRSKNCYWPCVIHAQVNIPLLEGGCWSP